MIQPFFQIEELIELLVKVVEDIDEEQDFVNVENEDQDDDSELATENDYIIMNLKFKVSRDVWEKS
jgi:hypothetical protein